MNFQIKSRWENDVIFECELSDDLAGMSYGMQLGYAVKQAVSKGANLLGANLLGANLSGVDLSDVDLSDVDLSDAKLSRANLLGTNLSGANLSGANLSGADLSDANLLGADLSGADLSGAGWIPKITNIHSAVYSAASHQGALDMRSWHCGTAHCRAGWVVTLAGDGGSVLEGVYGTSAAAALIYQESDPNLERIPDFYADNETALADMKRLADMEAARS